MHMTHFPYARAHAVFTKISQSLRSLLRMTRFSQLHNFTGSSPPDPPPIKNLVPSMNCENKLKYSMAIYPESIKSVFFVLIHCFLLLQDSPFESINLSEKTPLS